MNNALYQKVRALPAQQLYLLTCEKAIDLSVALTERYQLNAEQIGALSDLTARIYLKELRLADLYTEIKRLFPSDEAMSKRLTCDLAGFKLLAIESWLAEDVSNYIRSLGADPSDYHFETEELKRLAAAELSADELAKAEPVFEPLPVADDPEDGSESDDLSESSDAEIDPAELAMQFRDIIDKDLMELLNTNDNLFVAEFNWRLIKLLTEDESLHNDLINKLINSPKRLSDETIVLEGRQVEATVSNWIKSYIATKGSSMIDTITLSDFLVNATNARFLNEVEKRRLSRLLKFYSNIKYFPDSLVGEDPLAWELLPLSNDPDDIITPSTQSNRNQSPLDANQPDDKLAELKSLTRKYAEGSLERMVIDEEIKRLS
jgi:hypothetical protein